jgi:hypothetical protein
MISKCGAGLGLTVVISTANGENTSFKQSTVCCHTASLAANGVSVRWPLMPHVPWKPEPSIELVWPERTTQPFGLQLLRKILFVLTAGSTVAGSTSVHTITLRGRVTSGTGVVSSTIESPCEGFTVWVSALATGASARTEAVVAAHNIDRFMAHGSIPQGRVGPSGIG